MRPETEDRDLLRQLADVRGKTVERQREELQRLAKKLIRQRRARAKANIRADRAEAKLRSITQGDEDEARREAIARNARF